MGIAGTLFLVIFSITTLLIIALVMLQDEQGEGFGGLFGGSGSATPFGAVGGNILARATTVLGVLFMVSSLAVAMVYKSGKEDNIIQESHKAAGTGKNWFLAETDTPEEDDSLEETDTAAEAETVAPEEETAPDTLDAASSALTDTASEGETAVTANNASAETAPVQTDSVPGIESDATQENSGESVEQ